MIGTSNLRVWDGLRRRLDASSIGALPHVVITFMPDNFMAMDVLLSKTRSAVIVSPAMAKELEAQYNSK